MPKHSYIIVSFNCIYFILLRASSNYFLSLIRLSQGQLWTTYEGTNFWSLPHDDNYSIAHCSTRGLQGGSQQDFLMLVLWNGCFSFEKLYFNNTLVSYVLKASFRYQGYCLMNYFKNEWFCVIIKSGTELILSQGKKMIVFCEFFLYL